MLNLILFIKNVHATFQLPVDYSLTTLPQPSVGQELDILSQTFSKLTDQKIDNAQQVKL